MSVIETNLNNALQEHKAGTINDTSYSTIIDTVIPDLRTIAEVPGFGLQRDLSNLSSAIEKSPGKLVGADFDPDADAFTFAVERLAKECAANQSPISIASTTGG